MPIIIEWRTTALENLIAIARYIGKDNPKRAKSFRTELHLKIEDLSNHPKLGRVGRITGTRELIIHQNYIAIYRISAKKITILHIKHAAQKFP